MLDILGDVRKQDMADRQKLVAEKASTLCHLGLFFLRIFYALIAQPPAQLFTTILLIQLSTKCQFTKAQLVLISALPTPVLVSGKASVLVCIILVFTVKLVIFVLCIIHAFAHCLIP